MRDINAAELKKKYVDKEVALTAIKRAGREDVHIVGRTGEPMMDLAIATEVFQQILKENAKYFRSKREARVLLIEMMEEMCHEAFEEVGHEKVS